MDLQWQLYRSSCSCETGTGGCKRPVRRRMMHEASEGESVTAVVRLAHLLRRLSPGPEGQRSQSCLLGGERGEFLDEFPSPVRQPGWCREAAARDWSLAGRTGPLPFHQLPAGSCSSAASEGMIAAGAEPLVLAHVHQQVLSHP